MGTGVFEIVEDDDGDTFRTLYTVRFAQAVYVLHAFQKKSKSGIKTPREDIELAARRLRSAGQHYASIHQNDLSGTVHE
ncbi:type II toxin-antitoxin system RelE/ParE family toxin [Solidesulfovibrio aerotolerans]|uniref:type II toxin-antitoxin system RelE/ParE family toxin n=1 Tax=Solidesulfovibrio aerotolerans TaxID=295255 RepID=UPI001FECEADC|nr:type II toxin-antitoxin system RelE/ParE family toxin [Solidesulfovibrio aerotolerans]